MKAPISLCMIVRNEESNLENCLLSIKDYVSEIVIVDTGSNDRTPEIAQKYAHKFEVFTGCNDELNRIDDFSMARQRSFDLASQPWVFWIDGDDVVRGGENLYSIIQKYEHDKITPRYLSLPYEYSKDPATGQVNLVHYRERLFFKHEHFHWVNPVHECCIPKGALPPYGLENYQDVVMVHCRDSINKPVEPGRNLRILKKWYEVHGESDARQLYYLGLEYANNNDLTNAITFLNRYVELSGWEDEKYMALLKLIQFQISFGGYGPAIALCFDAIKVKENWGEAYFKLGECYHYLAQRGENEMRNWEKCATYTKIGLSLPPTQTLLFVNPQDRNIHAHRILNMALGKLGDFEGALESTLSALKYVPNDEQLLNNKRIYENYIANLNISKSVALLGANKQWDDEKIQAIQDLLHGTNTKLHREQEWNIPTSCDLDALPLNISDEQLQASVIMLWKQFALQEDVNSAAQLIENLPKSLSSSFIVYDAINYTRSFANTKRGTNYLILNKETAKRDGKLDIIFFAGDGVEVWTPETIKKTGIGGSELMLTEQAKRLAALGHRVRVFSGCGSLAGIYDNVEYHQTSKYQNLSCDVLIVSRNAAALGDQFNIERRLTLLWLHDVFAMNATNELMLKADRVLCLSQWHKSYVLGYHNLHSDHVIVTRNGIDLSRFDKEIKRNRFKCVNSSSPDRSYPVLLSNWKRIKEAVLQAELHLYYGFKNWKFSAQHDRLQMESIERLEKQIEELKPYDVVFHDRINQDKLAEEFLSAGVLTYPSCMYETSCITVMEAQAAGLAMITSNRAALAETAGERAAALIDGEWTDQAYQDTFVSATIQALNGYTEVERQKLQQYAKDNFSLDQLANDWDKMLYELIDEIQINPVVPYCPTQPYK